MHSAFAPAHTSAPGATVRDRVLPGAGASNAGAPGAGRASVAPAIVGHPSAKPIVSSIGAVELLPARDVLGQGLTGALLESRQRWRDFTNLAADLVFETDAAGRLAFLAPDRVLGWDAAMLLGQPASELLLRPEPNPFALRTPARHLKAWLREAHGSAADDAPGSCFCFNIVPLEDAAGRFAGLRGCGRDVTVEMAEAAAQAAALRRAGTLETLVRQIRQQVLAPRMLAATLEALPTVLGCAGGAVLELGTGPLPLVLQHHGDDPAGLLAGLPPLDDTALPRYLLGPRQEPLALLPQAVRGATRHALLAWRNGGGRPFDADDRHLLLALADLLFVSFGNLVLQQELESQARTEGLTGLLNRRAFMADLRRRLDRRDKDGTGAGGALLFIDLDNFKPINDLLGHEAGDAALIAVAGLLRQMVRPTDLVARFGGDEFALWLHDADVAAARAEAICQAATELLPTLLRTGAAALTFSIGCAVRPARGTGNTVVATVEALLARADAAMYVAKRQGRNRWSIAALA